MNLNPFKLPEGVKVQRTPIKRDRWFYPKYGGPFSRDERVGEELYVRASLHSEWGSVYDIRTPLLPGFIKEPINNVRIKRKAVKMGREVLAHSQQTELRLMTERMESVDEDSGQAAENPVSQAEV